MIADTLWGARAQDPDRVLPARYAAGIALVLLAPGSCLSCTSSTPQKSHKSGCGRRPPTGNPRTKHFSRAGLERGGAEGDLMELNGWVSPQMLTRYGASARGARARRIYDRVMNDPLC